MALLIGSSAARAQEPAPDARALFEQGVALADAHAWQEAAARFRASLALEPRASTYFNLAVTLYRLELHAELVTVATRYLELRDPTRSDADRTEITRLRSEAISRVARVRIEVSPAEAEVHVDGAALTPSMLADDLVLDPGNHSVLARARGYVAHRSMLDARAGERTSLRLALTPQTTSPVPAAAAPRNTAAFTQPDARDEPATDGDSIWSSPWLWIGAGVVVAAAATVSVLLITSSDDPYEYPGPDPI